jgi:hypothetical protein
MQTALIIFYAKSGCPFDTAAGFIGKSAKGGTALLSVATRTMIQ